MQGISALDLVLINRHILGIQALNSPYQIIAADANRSQSISAVDIVELRKLILGIYPTGLPSNTSWRFVDKDYSFPDPADPFTTVFPEKKEVNVSPSGSAQEANFVAIKVGDVNNNAIASAQARPVTSVARMQSGAATRAGEIITVPVTYTGTESLEAFQLGIRFDPAVLRLIGPSQGDLPHFNAGNFGLTHVEQGEIRSLWFADPATPGEALRNGDILFYLSFQVKRHLPASAVLFDLDDKILPNAAWKPEGTEFALQSGQAAEDRAQEATLTTSSLKAVCQPNPTTGTAQLKVHADRAGSARLAIFGPFGRREWMKEVELNPGEQIFEIPEVAQLPAGVYFWKVLAPWGKTQGHLIKQ
ncbi:MAG: hypothetical protein IT260_11495 [Saprospiraceae bacterium]|nr:hypothetical protein [Saprospiraceae bacterium]